MSSWFIEERLKHGSIQGMLTTSLMKLDSHEHTQASGPFAFPFTGELCGASVSSGASGATCGWPRNNQSARVGLPACGSGGFLTSTHRTVKGGIAVPLCLSAITS